MKKVIISAFAFLFLFGGQGFAICVSSMSGKPLATVWDTGGSWVAGFQQCQKSVRYVCAVSWRGMGGNSRYTCVSQSPMTYQGQILGVGNASVQIQGNATSQQTSFGIAWSPEN